MIKHFSTMVVRIYINISTRVNTYRSTIHSTVDEKNNLNLAQEVWFSVKADSVIILK